MLALRRGKCLCCQVRLPPKSFRTGNKTDPFNIELARPFEPPTQAECLRFRYTTYMGENHPAESKVVVEFSPKDLGLNKQQQLKLKKLLGARWNPETNIAKMSCEQFDHQAQNKRYLGDLINKLVAEAKVCC